MVANASSKVDLAIRLTVLPPELPELHASLVMTTDLVAHRGCNRSFEKPQLGDFSSRCTRDDLLRAWKSRVAEVSNHLARAYANEFLCHQALMIRINIEQLKTFLSVVRLGGVRKAATALNLTQPAVTTRIKNLEEALSCDLFERSKSGMKLTKRGELLLTHAEKFEHLSELVEKDVVDPAGVEGRLRLGVSETIAQCWLPDLVARLYGLYPKLEIELNVDISTNLRAGLLNREIDLAILLGPISEYTVNNIELPGFDLAWYAAAGVTAEMAEVDYLSRPVMTYARNTRPYRELKGMLFERVGPDVSLFPSSSLSACFRLVGADLGVAVLPRVLGQDLVAAGQIREFDPGWVPSPLLFTASFLGEPKSHLVETAAKTALEVATEYLGDKISE